MEHFGKNEAGQSFAAFLSRIRAKEQILAAAAPVCFVAGWSLVWAQGLFPFLAPAWLGLALLLSGLALIPACVRPGRTPRDAQGIKAPFPSRIEE